MPYISPIERHIKEEGRVEGKAEGIIELLLDNVGSIPHSVTDRIFAINDSAKLSKLLKAAARVKSLDEFEGVLNSL